MTTCNGREAETPNALSPPLLQSLKDVGDVRLHSSTQPSPLTTSCFLQGLCSTKETTVRFTSHMQAKADVTRGMPGRTIIEQLEVERTCKVHLAPFRCNEQDIHSSTRCSKVLRPDPGCLQVQGIQPVPPPHYSYYKKQTNTHKNPTFSYIQSKPPLSIAGVAVMQGGM